MASDVAGQSVALHLRIEGIAGSREDAVQADQSAGVVHRGHVLLPDETGEGSGRDLCLPTVHPDRLLPGIVAREGILHPRGRGHRIIRVLGPVRNATDGENLLMIQELIEKRHPLILERPANPEMITV